MGPKAFNRTPEDSGREFRTTHWTVILAAAHKDAPGSTTALNELCCVYRPPVYAYIRRSTNSHEQAEDLTQDFFVKHLVEKDLFAGLTREGGRFRSFLLTVLKRFLINEHAKRLAQKRGGGKEPLDIDEQTGIADQNKPDREFDRQWALTLLQHVFAQLQAEYIAAKKKALFEYLQGCLPGSQIELSYAEASKTLGTNEATLRVYAERLRGRYRKLLRDAIAATVSSPEEIEEELRYLKRALAKT